MEAMSGVQPSQAGAIGYPRERTAQPRTNVSVATPVIVPMHKAAIPHFCPDKKSAAIDSNGVAMAAAAGSANGSREFKTARHVAMHPLSGSQISRDRKIQVASRSLSGLKLDPSAASTQCPHSASRTATLTRSVITAAKAVCERRLAAPSE